MPSELLRRQLIEGLGAVLVGAWLSGCSGGGDNDGKKTVEMSDDLVFDPKTVSISIGDTVVWENVGSVGHTVTAYNENEEYRVVYEEADYFASGGFDSEEGARRAYEEGDPESGVIAPGEAYEHTFEVQCEFKYFCISHEDAGMTGTVEVMPE